MRCPQSWRLLQWLSAAAVLAVSSPASSILAQDRALDASIRQLKSAMTVQRDGHHLDLLRSLRALDDAELAPYFGRLSESDDSLIRINGILGLAEVDPNRRVDPWLIHKLDAEVSRLQVINQAAMFSLLDDAAIDTMLAWTDLQETPRITLLAERIKRGGSVEPSEIEPMLASERDTVRAVAHCMMSHVTGTRDSFETYRTHLKTLPDREQKQARLWLFRDIGQYKLSGMLWWAVEVLAEADLDKRVAQSAIAAAIHADPAQGLPLWLAEVRADRSPLNLVRFGLLLLAMVSEIDIPAGHFQELRNGEALTEAIAGVGIALGSGEGGVEAFNTLIDLDHWQSSQHALFAADKLGTRQRSRFYQHVIRHVDRSESRPDDRVTLAVQAASRLLKVDPAATADLLVEIEDDSRTHEAILMGLLAADDVSTTSLARSVRRIGLGRADSLALVLIARHAEQLSPEEFRDLGIVASGGGRLSPSYQVQAAWLYIKHAAKIERAMSLLFSSG